MDSRNLSDEARLLWLEGREVETILVPLGDMVSEYVSEGGCVGVVQTGLGLLLGCALQGEDEAHVKSVLGVVYREWLVREKKPFVAAPHSSVVRFEVGQKVRLKAGSQYPGDEKVTSRHMKRGEVYEVETYSEFDFGSMITVKQIPRIAFNAALFEVVK